LVTLLDTGLTGPAQFEAVTLEGRRLMLIS